MFGLIKKAFFEGLTVLSSVNRLSQNSVSAIPFKCVSMTYQECKVRPEIVNNNSDQKLLIIIVMSLYFVLLVLKQVNAVVVVTILTIRMQKCVFLMLLNT